MSLWIFNPSEPAGNSEFSGGALLDGRVGPCGTCQSCPTHWRIHVALNPGPVAQDWGGTHILTRRIPDPPQLDARCVWLSPPAPPSAWPNPLPPFSLWRLAFAAWPTNDTATTPAGGYWSTRWTLSAGLYFWPLATTIDPRYLPGTSLDPANQLGFVGYTPSETDPFACLDTQTLWRVESNTQFPAAITLEPYWP